MIVEGGFREGGKGGSAGLACNAEPAVLLAWASTHAAKVKGGLLDLFYGVYQKDPDRCLDALAVMGVYVQQGDRTAVRRTAEFFLNSLSVSGFSFRAAAIQGWACVGWLVSCFGAAGQQQREAHNICCNWKTCVGCVVNTGACHPPCLFQERLDANRKAREEAERAEAEEGKNKVRVGFALHFSVCVCARARTRVLHAYRT